MERHCLRPVDHVLVVWLACACLTRQHSLAVKEAREVYQFGHNDTACQVDKPAERPDLHDTTHTHMTDTRQRGFGLASALPHLQTAASYCYVSLTLL